MKRGIVLLSLLLLAACVPPAPSPPPAPPPPGPVAAPPGARVFTVYFGWNRSWIGPSGMQVIAQAAAAFRSGAPVAVHVTGYADTSGSAAYNQRLSERRAVHVARALSRMGVPPNAIQVAGRGEHDLAVPTPDRVREPRNRRVTIVE
jgi:outer membrane protein OmpA-like peptidoglycan-associated protein